MSSRTQRARSEEHTSELQSHHDLVCRLLLEKKDNTSQVQLHHKHVGRRLFLEDSAHPRVTYMFRHPTHAPPLFSRRRARSPRHFFLNDRAPTEIYPLPLPGAFPI